MSTFDGIANDAPNWSPVPMWGVDCVALGGNDSDMNMPLHAIVQRLNWLKAFKGGAIIAGTGVPTNNVGVAGDYFLDRNAAMLYGPKADRQDVSLPGWGNGDDLAWNQLAPLSLRGSAGTSFLNGTTAPGNNLGTNGDFYLNTAASDLYGPKMAGVWPSPLSLKGEPGDGGFTTRVIFKTPGLHYWQVPAGVTKARFRAWGAGEGGLGNASLGLGGSAGAYSDLITYVAEGQIIVCEVGTGGAGGNNTGAAATAGGDTKIGPSTNDGFFIKAGGGSSTNGGVASGGDINLNGEASRYGSQFSGTTYPANGSISPQGGVGGRGNAFNPGAPGFAPGGGGGGGGLGHPGGQGAIGMVEILF